MKNRTLSLLRKAALQVASAGLFLIGVAVLSHSQTFTVLHNFSNAGDGAIPYAGVTLDQVGRLYGTTSGSGLENGNVYRMTHQGEGWTVVPLYNFPAANDGAHPQSRVVFGPQSRLYGTTEYGGIYGAGVIYDVHSPPTACQSVLCLWDQDVLYQMPLAAGYELGYGDLTFDAQGNIYGTAEDDGGTCIGSPGGGGGPQGNVYRLSQSDGVWSEKILWNFGDYSSGAQPTGGVILDAAGNVYGTTIACGDPQCNHQGTVFELTAGNGTCWHEQTLHAFAIDGSEGAAPIAGLVMDAAGNFYGATSQRGPNGGGTVFELSPANGGWTFQVLYAFTGSGNTSGPWRSLMMDAAGNLYGTTYSQGAFGYGSVFKLSRGSSGWTYTSLHDFSGSDGAYPLSNVIMDASGNLYGTTSAGGAGSACQGGCGVVWEITP